MDAVKLRVTARLSPLGAVAADGGEWAAAFGDRLDDATWETLRCELFPGAEQPSPQPPLAGSRTESR
jgi:hypothetical protein